MKAKTSDKSPDRRIGKTRAALGQALFALMQTTAWSDITIQAICDTANVARSSFYAHFATSTDLLQMLLAENLPRYEELEIQPNRLATLDWLIDHNSQNKKLFFRLMGSPSSAVVMSSFKAQTKITLTSELNARGIVPSETELAFVMGGVFEAIQHWAQKWKIADLPKLKDDTQQIAKAIFQTKA